MIMSMIMIMMTTINMSKKDISAGIVLMTDKNNVLICKPSESNMWTFPKGSVEAKETSLEAAIREVKEETGFFVGRLKHYLKPLPNSEYSHRGKICIFYLLPHLQDDEFRKFPFKCSSIYKNNIPEIEEYRIVNLDKAKSILHYSQKHLIDYIYENYYHK